MWSLMSVFGAITSNCLLSVYDGELLWQPFDIIAKWVGPGASSGGRAAAFFCAAIWAFGNLATNITANSISAANDMCTLYPRFINILRGQMIAVTAGCFLFCPWEVLASAGAFVSTSYSFRPD